MESIIDRPYNSKITGDVTNANVNISALPRKSYIKIGNIVELCIGFTISNEIEAGHEYILLSDLPELYSSDYIVCTLFEENRSNSPIRVSIRGTNLRTFYTKIPVGKYEGTLIYLSK